MHYCDNCRVAGKGFLQSHKHKSAHTHSFLPAGLAWYWAESLLGCWTPGRLPAPGSDSITCTHAPRKGLKKKRKKKKERHKVQWQKSNKEHMGGEQFKSELLTWRKTIIPSQVVHHVFLSMRWEANNWNKWWLLNWLRESVSLLYFL